MLAGPTFPVRSLQTTACACSAPESQQVSSSSAGSGLAVVVPTERALGRLAALLVRSLGMQAGDVYCLHGDVGAGKSVFSRAYIRAAAGDPLLNVPSPTYLLQVSGCPHFLQCIFS